MMATYKFNIWKTSFLFSFILASCHVYQQHITDTKTIYSDSCELADVKAAIAEANPGDTVVVPKGEARWDSQLVINKGIVLKAEIVGGTTITLPANADTWRNGAILYLDDNQSNNDPFRLSGFVFDGGGVCHKLVELDTKNGSPVLNKVRIDHNVFQNGYSGGARFLHKSGAIYILFDNNTVYFSGAYDFISVYDSNGGYDAWASRPFYFGSADQNYFEDNVYYKNDNHMVYMTGYGARYCSRHNTYDFSMDSGNVYVYDVHGNMTDTWSVIGFEAYNETINANGLWVNLCDGRGGNGLIYDIDIQNASGMNTRIREEYDDYLLDPPYQLQTGEPQYPNDWYLWNIYVNDVKSFTYEITVGSTLYYFHLGRYVPLENQEYWREKSSFNGSSGMGVGPISRRPLSCSKEGVAWWATDENKLYKWHNGKWELYYVPYTYPHPLRTF